MKLKSVLIILTMIFIITAISLGCSDSEDSTKTVDIPTPSATQTPATPPPTTETIETNVPSPTTTSTPEVSPDPLDNPIAVMSTNFGDITIELYEDKLPITVDNFVKLVNDGFYDDTVFHRIKDNFMIQAGLETIDGTMKFSPYGPIVLETHPDVTHVDGAISMARTSQPDSATSQFFICDGPQHFLDNSYAAFGAVIEGIEVVQEIAAQKHDNSNPAGGGVPLEQIVINSVEIQ